MPLLPALPIFHSSSSSKSPKLSFVTRSSTSPSFESTPPATCQPAGKPGSFQPRQSGALSSCSRDRQCPGAAGSAAPGGIALCIRRPRNVTDLIADRVLVGRTELRERRPRTPCRFRLEPLQPVEDDPPVPLVAGIGRAHPLIDELDHSRCRGARRALIGR